MQKIKCYSIAIFVFAVSLQLANAANYVDLDQYKGYVSVEQPIGNKGLTGVIEAPAVEFWNTLKSSLNETMVSDKKLALFTIVSLIFRCKIMKQEVICL